MSSNRPRQNHLPPFSEGEHGSYLSKITQRLSSIKDEIQATIDDNLTQFTQTLDHTTQLSHQADRVASELKDIKSRVNDTQNSIFSVIIDSTKKRRALIEQERHTSVLISILKALVEVKVALSELSTLIQQRKFASALKKRLQTSQLISALPGSYTAQNEPVIYTTVKREFRRLEQEMIDILQMAFTTAFKFDSNTLSLTFSTPSFGSSLGAHNNILDKEEESMHNISLATCLVMLSTFQLAEPRMPSITSVLFRFIDAFLPETSNGKSTPAFKESRSGNQAVLTIIDGKANTAPLHLIVSGLSATIALFQFITDHLIAPMEAEASKLETILKTGEHDTSTSSSISTFCSTLGSYLLSYTVDRLVRSSFEPSLPQQRSQLEVYQRDVSAEVDKFVPHLSQYSWLHLHVSSTESAESLTTAPLGWASVARFIDFLKNSQLHFATRKKRIAIARARELVLSGVYTSQVVGDLEFSVSTSSPTSASSSTTVSPHPSILSTSIFKFPQCRVRNVVVELMEMCENLIAEAFEETKSSLAPNHTEIQTILLETAKDILDLYRCIVPTFDETRIARTPSLAMLFHNDCQYIAHRVTLMVGKYRVHMMRSMESQNALHQPLSLATTTASSLTTAPSPSPSIISANGTASTSTTPFVPPPILHSLSSSVSASATPSPSTLSARSAPSIRMASSSVPPIERPYFTFMDLIPVFRSLAEQYYIDIVSAMREHLLSLLEVMADLVDTSRPERKRKCLVSMREIVSELEKTDGMWSETLPSEFHKVTMGLLVNDVVEWLISKAFSITDFAADETESLNQIFSALFPVAKLFLDLSDISSSNNSGEENATNSTNALGKITKESCAKYVKSWLKYEDLTDAFVLPMVQIAERYNDRSLHFKRTEVVSLIKALFSDSSKRAERIASLRTDLD